MLASALLAARERNIAVDYTPGPVAEWGAYGAAPGGLTADDAWGLTFWDRGACRKQIEALRNEGIFTPPSVQGSAFFPSDFCGNNWGTPAIDPGRKFDAGDVFTALPWGMQTAIDFTTGDKRWEVPLGSLEEMVPWPVSRLIKGAFALPPETGAR